jgi:NAD(P)-dependent dehydrogenase (short-subunit alcohol dehydrogenase family)
MTNLPSLQGKIVLITGASSGIGKETGRAIASLGATTLLVGRNHLKLIATANEFYAQTGNQQIVPLVADLSSLDEVHRLAKEILDRFPRLDVLVNNAGALFMLRQASPDGNEMTLALNHLAPFLLTHLLMPALNASPSARIINVSSEAHRGTHIDLDNLQNEHGYSGWRAYGQSKLANIYFTYGLAAYVDGANITANCLHPGFVATNFGRSNGGIFDPIFRVAQVAAISPRVSAQAITYLATSPDLESVTARYFNLTREVRSSEISYDMNIARHLWNASLELTHLAEPERGALTIPGIAQTVPARKYR